MKRLCIIALLLLIASPALADAFGYVSGKITAKELAQGQDGSFFCVLTVDAAPDEAVQVFMGHPSLEAWCESVAIGADVRLVVSLLPEVSGVTPEGEVVSERVYLVAKRRL